MTRGAKIRKVTAPGYEGKTCVSHYWYTNGIKSVSFYYFDNEQDAQDLADRLNTEAYCARYREVPKHR